MSDNESGATGTAFIRFNKTKYGGIYVVFSLEILFMLLLDSGSDPKPFKRSQILHNHNVSILVFTVKFSLSECFIVFQLLFHT